MRKSVYQPATKEMITAKYLARHFQSIQKALGRGDLGNVYWLPGAESPADGLTKMRSYMVTLLR